MKLALWCFALSAFVIVTAQAAPKLTDDYFDQHCTDCHDAEHHKAGLDLTALKPDFANPDLFSKWVKVYDRIDSGEMPPKKRDRPPADETKAVQAWLQAALLAAEKPRLAAERTGLRRLTRSEYENTIRDLFELPGIELQGELPADGSAHGFDTNADALDISHVTLAKYLESADRTLDMAICTRPTPPTVVKQRISLANPAGFVANIIMNGDGVLLKDKKPDPDFPPAGEFKHLDQGAHERMGSFTNGASVGLFRHEDESVSPYFIEFVALYPGNYRVTTSLWAFQWDKGQVLPARGSPSSRSPATAAAASTRAPCSATTMPPRSNPKSIRSPPG